MLFRSECGDCIDGHVLSSVQALLMMRGDLVDYILKNKGETVVVKVNPALVEAHKEVDVFSVDKEKVLKGAKVYLLPDETLKRSKYIFEKATNEDNIPSGAVLL